MTPNASTLKNAAEVQRRLRSLTSPESAALAKRFFKTGCGQYSENDQFLGLRAKDLHAAAKAARALPIDETRVLIRSPIHDDRTVALLILVNQFHRGDPAIRKVIYDFYLLHTKHINNWDLVDCSAAPIVGRHLADRSRKPLDRLARSESLWERRISVVATHWFVRLGEFEDSLRIAKTLLSDREDLIHKAVGWTLREVGKRDQAALERFLDRHAETMPRTALRYVIERFPEPLRQSYLRARAASGQCGDR